MVDTDSNLTTEGLIVAGCRPQCGKTAVVAGLAMAMKKNGIEVLPIKPIDFKGLGDQTYIDKLTRPLQPMVCQVFESPRLLTQSDWSRVLHHCGTLPYPALIESAGSIASPLAIIHDEIYDVTSLSVKLGLPILLVVEKTPYLFDEVRPAIAFIKDAGAELAGWLAVETNEQQSSELLDWDYQTQYITQHYELPFFGQIAYSPSINVKAGQQGNLLRNTEDGIDLLPIQMLMKARVPNG